ncbi:hypothetical protein BC831DRAFT_482153, partial [Entophlyctis helioformis]
RHVMLTACTVLGRAGPRPCIGMATCTSTRFAASAQPSPARRPARLCCRPVPACACLRTDARRVTHVMCTRWRVQGNTAPPRPTTCRGNKLPQMAECSGTTATWPRPPTVHCACSFRHSLRHSCVRACVCA